MKHTKLMMIGTILDNANTKKVNDNINADINNVITAVRDRVTTSSAV